MQDFIKSSLEYIEQNIKTDITADELAAQANYSAGHFCRLFAHAMDSTVGSYILKRRLDHALAEISQGQKAVNVVLEYGFETYAGFYKAFVKMYGCAPRKYLTIYKKSEVFIMHSITDIQALLVNWAVVKGQKVEDVSTRHWKTGEIEWPMWKIGDDYYLKTNERSRMIKNIRIAKALKKEGLASEFLPVLTDSGEDYVDGKQIFLLTKKVGEPLNTRPLSDEEVANMRGSDSRRKYAHKLGQTIAKLHRALKSVQEDVQPYEANIYLQSLDSMPKVKAYCAKYNFEIDNTFFDEYTKIFGELYDKVPKQLIHGNPTVESVVYENGEIVGLKGYEIYNMSYVRLFDLIWCAGEIHGQPDIETYLKVLTDILKGYNSLNALTEEEKQAIYYVLCAVQMNSIVYCGDDMLDTSKRSLKALVFLANNKGLFEGLFEI